MEKEKIMKRNAFTMTLFALAAVGVVTALSQANGQQEAVRVGQPSPDFALKTLDGEEVTLESIKEAGGGYLVFFTTVCPHCIREIPHLNALVTEAAETDNPLTLYGVNPGQAERMVQRFARKNELKYPVLYDKERQALRAFGVTGVPTIVGIGADGGVKYFEHRMVKDLDEARQILK